MAVLEHVARDDEAAPGEQALRSRKSLSCQPQGNHPARLGKQARQPLRRKTFVRARDGQEYRIHGQRMNALEGSPHEPGETSRLRALDE